MEKWTSTPISTPVPTLLGRKLDKVITLLTGWFPWYTDGEGLIIAAPTLTRLFVAFLAWAKDNLLGVLRRIVHWRAGTRGICFLTHI